MSAPAPLTAERIARIRLANQCIEPSAREPVCETPRAVVEHLGALQAQDYRGVLWSIGLRLPHATEADVERAFERREIVRTWPMRGTLHVVSAADARWMLELLAPRVIARTAARREALALDDVVLERAAALFTGALLGGGRLSRLEMLQVLERGGIPTAGQRGYHILFNLSMRRVIVFGPRDGRDQTFVLFDEWLPDAPGMPAAEALALIVRRYFTSHGPATAKDFAGWSGLTIADANEGIAANSETLIAEKIGRTAYWMPRATVAASNAPAGTAAPRATAGRTAPAAEVHLLPGFDEYLLGYKDRSAVLHTDYSERIVPGGNGVFKPTVVIDGQVRGTWKRFDRRGVVTVEATPFTVFSVAERKAIDESTARYLRFTAPRVT